MTIDPRSLLVALAAQPEISGSTLAARFGVTRAAVWKQIECLRALGVPIEAHAGAGYRLRKSIDLVDAEVIGAALPVATAQRLGRIDVRWQVDSTNSELLRRAQAGDADANTCFAEIQSAGRGRRGRHWVSALGGGLVFSLSRRFESSMAALAGLSLAVGVGVVRALEDFGYSGIGLKWPNDVQHGGRKLAGILVELGGDALGPCHAVIGVGLNLALDEGSAARIDQSWVDLASTCAQPLPERNLLAARLLARLMEILDQFAHFSFSSIAGDFAKYDVLCGQAVRIMSGRDQHDGIAIGVDRLGALRVRAADGEMVVDSGEVSVRAVPGANP